MATVTLSKYMLKKLSRLRWGQLLQKSPGIIEYLVYDTESKSRHKVTCMIRNNAWCCDCLSWVNNFNKNKSLSCNLQKAEIKKDCSHIIRIKYDKNIKIN